jgi:hypothetical protein
MLEHALECQGGWQNLMLKQMRSTARTTGTEDHNVNDNAQRSRGAGGAV